MISAKIAVKINSIMTISAPTASLFLKKRRAPSRQRLVAGRMLGSAASPEVLSAATLIVLLFFRRALTQTHPRIHNGVKNIAQQIGDAPERRHQQHGGHNHRVITQIDARDEELA